MFVLYKDALDPSLRRVKTPPADKPAHKQGRDKKEREDHQRHSHNSLTHSIQ